MAHERLPRRSCRGVPGRSGCTCVHRRLNKVHRQWSAPTPKTGLEATITADTAARCEAFSFIVAAAQAARGLAMTGGVIAHSPIQRSLHRLTTGGVDADPATAVSNG